MPGEYQFNLDPAWLKCFFAFDIITYDVALGDCVQKGIAEKDTKSLIYLRKFN